MNFLFEEKIMWFFLFEEKIMFCSQDVYNTCQNIWHKVKQSSKIGQHFKNLLSNFARFLTGYVKV